MNNIYILIGLLFLFGSVYNSVNAQGLASTESLIEVDTFRQVNNNNNKIVGGKDKKKADKLYHNLGYKASTRKYRRLLKKGKLPKGVMANMANSFRLNHETESAEYWYARFVTEDSEPEHILHFSQVLQSNENCEDALFWYNVYEQKVEGSEDDHRSFIKDCITWKNFKENKAVEIYNLESLNSSHLDYSPIPYGDGMVFTSTRGTDRVQQTKDSWTDDNFTDLFYAENVEGKLELKDFTTPTPLIGANGKYHDGIATFSDAGNVMFFTRNNLDGKSKEGCIDLKIYVVTKEDDYWGEAKELPFNTDDFAYCHPTVSSSGKILYFTSNISGGYGGMDLYFCESKGGTWSKPENLGPTINTAGNEIFPFIAPDKTLYFASDGHTGIGGLDIFKVEKPGKAEENSWSKPKNLGKPFNSTKDDFGFWISKDKKNGYLSSSREGGLGKDDIYAWNLKEDYKDEIEDVERNICVYKNGTTEKIEKAVVTIAAVTEDEYNREDLLLKLKPTNTQNNEFVFSVTGPEDEKTLLERKIFTDASGFFKHKINSAMVYNVHIEKDGYQVYSELISAKEILESDEYCIPLDKKLCINLSGVVTDKEDNKAIPNSRIIASNKSTGKEATFTTDANGAFDFCLDCDTEYQIKAAKASYNADYEFINTATADCSSDNNLLAELVLSKRKIVSSTDSNATNGQTYSQPVAAPTVSYQAVTQYKPVTTYEPITTYVPVPVGHGVPGTVGHHVPGTVGHHAPGTANTHFLGSPFHTLYEGQTLELKNIHYDFNKSTIRGDASIDLDKVVQAMRTHPGLEIALESHTDSRGTANYNLQLSSSRAGEARKYILDRGIEARRIKFVGLGETQLKNECGDGVDCSKEKHQANRRTEVRILKLN